MNARLQLRNVIIAIISFAAITCTVWLQPQLSLPLEVLPVTPAPVAPIATGDAATTLNLLAVKGRAPKTDYARTQFGSGWLSSNGCDTRNVILSRDLTETIVNDRCQVVSGTLHDPYSGTIIPFIRGEVSSQAVQIDHVVALSNAWQTGAQQLTRQQRIELANDPLELLAVDGLMNQQKSDSDAASWLPPNKSFRCQYIARQIAIKHKYQLWVTSAEKDAMRRVLSTCPGQPLPNLLDSI